MKVPDGYDCKECKFFSIKVDDDNVAVWSCPKHDTVFNFRKPCNLWRLKK